MGAGGGDILGSSKENRVGVKNLHEVCSFEISHNKEKLNSHTAEHKHRKFQSVNNQYGAK